MNEAQLAPQDDPQLSHAVPIASLIVDMLDLCTQEASDGAPGVTGVRTGFNDLDKMTTGLQPGELIIVAGRPSMGKTSLALNIAEHVTVREGLPVHIFSMGPTSKEITNRVAASLGRIDLFNLRTGRLRDDEWGRLSTAVEQIRNANCYIDDTPGMSVQELCRRAKRQAAECGQLGLIVVDDLHWLHTGNSVGTEEKRAAMMGDVARALKALGRELKCPVIAVSPLNRSVETRIDKRPMLNDLRDSGAVEDIADVIFFIYRDEYYTKDQCKEPGVTEIIIGKQSNGPVGTIKLAFLRPLTKFENLAPGYVDASYD